MTGALHQCFVRGSAPPARLAVLLDCRSDEWGGGCITMSEVYKQARKSNVATQAAYLESRPTKGMSTTLHRGHSPAYRRH
eukprot:12454282-Alexandrium_andersonii.AAC.1